MFRYMYDACVIETSTYMLRLILISCDGFQGVVQIVIMALVKCIKGMQWLQEISPNQHVLCRIKVMWMMRRAGNLLNTWKGVARCVSSEKQMKDVMFVFQNGESKWRSFFSSVNLWFYVTSSITRAPADVKQGSLMLSGVGSDAIKDP